MDSKPFKALLENIRGGSMPASVIGMSGNTKIPLLLALQLAAGRPVLFVAQNDFECHRLADETDLLLPGEAVYLPCREILLRRISAHSLEASSRRIASLGRILSDPPKITFASLQSIRTLLPPRDTFLAAIRHIEKGHDVDLDALSIHLNRTGYERVASVEGRGQYAIRGGIVDIFPVQSESACRLELSGDEVESIREMDTQSQRSAADVQGIAIYPATEAPVPQNHTEKAIRSLMDASLKADGMAREYLEDSAQTLGEGGSIEGAETLIPLLYENAVSLLDYLPNGILICLDEPSRLEESAAAEGEFFSAQAMDMLEKGEITPDMARQYLDTDDVFAQCRKMDTLIFSAFPQAFSSLRPASGITLNARTPAAYRGRTAELVRELGAYKKRQWQTVLCASTDAAASRMKAMLLDNGLETTLQTDAARSPAAGEILITPAPVSQGAEYPDIKYLVLSEKEIFGIQVQKRKPVRRGKGAIESFIELKHGDYVVHEQHGIAVYHGLKTLKIDGSDRDFLMLQYARDDTLYVPTDQIQRVQKYIGSDDSPPRVSRLGGAEWERTKNRVAQSVRELAVDLVALYSDRQRHKGFAYTPDTTWQKQFEDGFPHEETADQIQSIAEIKADMESGRIMDRLLCGDVGYGKTEVAARAAFKAVMDSKQTALLVPTTLLAQQHFNTFTERFTGFPVRIGLLSRFRPPTEAARTLKALREGNIDIVIGTHMLLGDSVKFKDLGLLIVDEEHRFGVEHKEKIKAWKQTIDVLTLSATPIPRTLEMSLAGIRDMSVIETPPEDRFPVQTYVMEHSESMIREAILKELSRGGQVYFVYNQVVHMERFLGALRALIPEARIAMAHGQMHETELENVMMSFYDKTVDVLLCSTIIESGLDIPNANTLIVYDADRLGLAQLYQLRGRVGRSNRVAYAFFTFRRDKALTEAAQKRLETIREFTEFGAGFRIAMRDLQIRGAGNLLGAQQHGHLHSVGYDMYVRLMREAVSEARGSKAPETREASFSMDIEAYIPRSYIEDESLRIEAYKTIGAIESENHMLEVQQEFRERYGPVPAPVKNLLDIANLRQQAVRAGLASITTTGSEAVLTYNADASADLPCLLELLKRRKDDLRLSASQPPSIRMKLRQGTRQESLQALCRLVQELTVCMGDAESV
jgi:transcription-repair coupling factor (superfamily II helicase)